MGALFLCLFASFSCRPAYSQDSTNTYSGQIHVSGTVGYVYPNFSAELQPTNYPSIIIHTTAGGVLSPQAYTISNSGSGNADFRIEWILNGVAASYAANSEGSPTTYYYPNDVRFAMSAYTDYTPRNPLVKMDLTNGSGGVLDTVYIQFSTSELSKTSTSQTLISRPKGQPLPGPSSICIKVELPLPVAEKVLQTILQ